MNFKDWASTPPMGWNSYDYYNTSVTEDDVKRNADYMAKYLKPYGWEYVVVDIEWYACHASTARPAIAVIIAVIRCCPSMTIFLPADIRPSLSLVSWFFQRMIYPVGYPL